MQLADRQIPVRYQEIDEPFFAVFLASGALLLRHSIGVEDEQVAGIEYDRPLPIHFGVADPEDHPALSETIDIARLDQEGGAVTGVGEFEPVVVQIYDAVEERREMLWIGIAGEVGVEFVVQIRGGEAVSDGEIPEDGLQRRHQPGSLCRRRRR